MTDKHWSWTLNRHIPSDTAVGIAVIDELLAQLAAHRWSEIEVFGIHLSVEEAIVNAIKHGNQFDDEKEVHILFKLSRDRLYLRIEDQGEGFDPEGLPDPTSDEYLERASGRGVMLMRHYMSAVQFNSRGNLVEMTKERQMRLN